jgi:transposase
VKEARRQLVYEVVTRDRRGESRRQIARALGIAPRTVKKILDNEEKRRAEGESAIERELPARRAPRASKLDVYEERITAWLEEYPDLTATRLLEKLEAEGFTGKYTVVRQHLKALRGRTKPKRAVEIVETPPGHQGQFDWSPYEIERKQTVQLWSFTLAWSRARSFAVTDNIRQTTILERLVESFTVLGGVPAECVTDSMSGVVDRWECNRPILNVRFVDFAAYYGFAAHIAPRGDGAYKGKVERPFRYVEENLFNGRTFHSSEELREVLKWWTTERAMRRPHPVTGRPLAEMLEEERPHLQPLPPRPYDTREVVMRLVDSTAHVLHSTNLYPVEEKYIGELVYVCVGPERLEIYDRGVHRIGEHERLADGAGRRVPSQRAKRGRYDVTLLCERLAAWSPAAEDFARRLRERKRYPGPELSHIVGLVLTWSADDIVAAIEHAMRYDAYEARAVERILEARYKPRGLAQQIADATRGHIREVMKGHPVEQRPLSSYETLRTGDPLQKKEVPRDRDEDRPPDSPPDSKADDPR